MTMFKRVRSVSQIVGSFTKELRLRKEEQQKIVKEKAEKMDIETEVYRAKMDALSQDQKAAIEETMSADNAIKAFENLFNQTQQSVE